MELFDSIKDLIHIIEKYHDNYTKTHEEKTGKLMKILSTAMGLEKNHCLSLQTAGNLHDIGKLSIPANILEKQDKLTSFERQIVQLHVEIGHEFMKKIKDPIADLTATVILAHHENFDGSGYPNQLKGNSIPIEGRICAICDVYDAMRSFRPYRAQATHEQVITAMQSKDPDKLSNKFDPEILELFIQIQDQYRFLYDHPILPAEKSDYDQA